MILNSTTHFRGATAAAALCFLFAHSANADCGLSALPQAMANAANLAARPGSTAHLQADNANAKTGQGDITGLWLTTFTSGGQTVDQGFDAWTSDGLEILNDTPPPASGNVCLGTWVAIGPNTYLLKHPSWTFDAAGNLTGTAIIRETVTVQPDKNSFKGTFTIDILNLGGTVIQHFAGTVSATRITVD